MPIRLRRLLVALIVLASAGGMIGLLAGLLAPDGWGPRSVLLLACFVATAPWIGLCVANGVLGFLLLMLSPDPVRAVVPLLPGDPPLAPGPARTAIAVTVRSEDMRQVLPPLRRLLDGLDATAWRDRIALFVLSDTQAGEAAAAEAAAVEAFRIADRDAARVHYRRRAVNDGFKAGNFMDFLDHHADGFSYALTLDADSKLTAVAAIRLIRAMDADPTLGILQHLTVGAPAGSALPRVFQFGMRAGMRVWAVGQAWWQDDAGPYWGHNAIVRIAPFRTHGRLPLLPGGGVILSHDQVEAAQLRGAGWGVRVLPEEDGSAEDNPPALPEFIRRDRRWMAGNFQYRHLLRQPGLRPMGRWQLLQAILLFAGAPFHTVLILLASLGAAQGWAPPAGRVAALTVLWLAAIYLPKLLGYVQVLASPALRRRYGGGPAFARNAVLEIGFGLLLDAIMGVSKTLGMLRLLAGAPPGWLPQNRADRGVRWGEAARLLWPHTLLGAAIFLGCALGRPLAVLWAVPVAPGLLLAIPFCVLTSNPRVGAWCRARGIAATPEELAAVSPSPLVASQRSVNRQPL